MHKRNGVTTRDIAEVPRQTPPEHYDIHSKMLVTPESTKRTCFDSRVSSCQPEGYVAPYRHKVQKQVYRALDGERFVVRTRDVTRVPPNVAHAIFSSGLRDPVFSVITTPPTGDPV